MSEQSKKMVVIIMGIVLILLMAISFGGRERITFIESYLGSALSPVQRFLSGIGNFVDEKTEPVLNVLNYKTKNENLSRENQRLKEQIIELTMKQKNDDELEALSYALKYVKRNGIEDYVSCNVISKDVGNWFNMFTIDVGLNQGVVKKSTVINEQGLVGLVYEVGRDWAKVISIIDHKSAVGFEMLRVTDDYHGILSGTSNYELVGELYDLDATVNVDDFIVTSGLGMYPRGILIGRIYEVIEDKDLFFKKIKVVPAVNFKKLNKVMVIPYHGPLEGENNKEAADINSDEEGE